MRKPRHLLPGARYHVSARAQRQEMILDSEAMKQLFLDTVARAKQKYSFRLESFTILGNHFHLIVQPFGETNLSRLMQWIMSVFAMAWNRLHGLTGHVWGQRFFSRVIDGLGDFLTVLQYIDLNPVRAGLVSVAEDWAFGSAWFRSRGVPPWLDALPDW